ncbi:MAG: hypothetical protein IJR55_02140 [Clostridia bacterium]|nr:hypothetical protein [Clostridia bacterium]
MLLYIDISAVSMVIPIIAGIIVVISSSVYLIFRRAKSKISKKLGIDENAGKEVEEDVVINDEETSDAENESASEKTDVAATVEENKE